MRIALVDDNPIDRINLRSLLSEHSRVRLVGEAADLEAARSMLADARPDALFLDVELGRENGFRLLDAPWLPPRIVFTTLHQHYAVEAFEVQAVDYLLKPVMPERLDRALARLFQATDISHAAGEKRVGESPRAPDDLLVFKQGNERRVLPVSKIVWITGGRDYTRVVTADGKEYLDTRRMRDWQAILPPKLFQLLDRSTIVNLGEIASYRPTHGGAQVMTRNGNSATAIGAAAFKRLEECLENRGVA